MFQAKGTVPSEPYRLSETHDMFTSLVRILCKSATDLDNKYWIPLMEQAINVIYKLAECPDKICGDLIKKLAMEGGKMVSEREETDKEAGHKTTAEGGEMEPEHENPLDILGTYSCLLYFS